MLTLLLFVTALHAATVSSAPAQAAHVDWSHALETYGQLERWLEAGDVALPPDAPVRPIWVSDVSGVKVTVRWLGLPMGSGISFPAPPALGQAAPGDVADADRVVDLLTLAQEAMKGALAEVRESLTDAHRRAMTGAGVASDKDRKARAAATVQELAKVMTVELQIARHAEAITLGGDAPPDAIYRAWASGFHGLVMTRVDDSIPGARQIKRAWTWPGTVIATNASPQGQLVGMLNDLNYGLMDLPRIARPMGFTLPQTTAPASAPGLAPPLDAGGPATPVAAAPPPQLARFEVIHMTRSHPRQPVMQLVRGNAVLPPQAVGGATLEAAADRIVGFLLRRQRDDGSMSGTYQPSADRYDPATAPLQDVALACYALARQARYLAEHPSVNATKRGEEINKALDASMKMLLAKLTGQRAAKDESVATALTLMTLNTAPHLAGSKSQRDELTATLLSLRDGQGLFTQTGGEKQARAGLPVQALLLAALATSYERTRDAKLKVTIDETRTALWKDIAPSHVPGTLPWLSQAELTMRRLEAPEDSAAAAAFARRAALLREVAQALRSRQAQGTQAVGPTDVVGGFDLSRRDEQTPANPDWRTAHYLAFLAQGLARKDMVPENDRLRWLLDSGLAARFLVQLMFDEPACFYVRSREDVLGGVRPALWDNRLSVAPSAMSLIALCELREALAAMNTR